MSSKSSYIFLKLQILAVCGVAVWLLYSPPNLADVKFSIRGKTTKTPPIYNASNDKVLRLLQSSKQRDVGADERSVTNSNAVTPRAPLGDHDEDVDDEAPDEVILDALMNVTGDEPSDAQYGRGGKRKWVIKWEDRNFGNTDSLPLGDGADRADLRKDNADHVIFNRVGKCGSRSVLTLLDRLARVNQFYLLSSQTFNQKHIGFQDEEKLVSILSRVDGPFIYQRHLHFINFTKYGGAPPTYINIIRDPLERAVSQYYFVRFGDEKKEERKFNSTDPFKYMSYEECVRRRLKECVGKKAFYIIPFFCGQDKRCTYPSLWAYLRAKENVEKSYQVVGVLEELHDTLQVFEKVLPRMFQGALKTYLKFEQIEHSQKKSSVGVTKYKQKPSEQTAQYMRAVIMKYEYLFYNWIKDRLHGQMEGLGLRAYSDEFR